MEREVDWRSMIAERMSKQTKLANKPGKKSSEEFKPGDRVIIQEHSGRKQWIDSGVIEKARISDDVCEEEGGLGVRVGVVLGILGTVGVVLGTWGIRTKEMGDS